MYERLFAEKHINPWCFNKFEDTNDSNDAADEIINQPDKYLLNQQQLFAAQGGFSTVSLALAGVAFGTLAIFAGAPRTAVHFRNGQMSFSEWACLGSSALVWYGGMSWVGLRTFGDNKAVHNHWMAYTFVKA